MFGWLKSKGENSRVYMCIKEVKWDLEQRNPSQTAQILIIAQNLRHDSFQADQQISRVLDNPFIATRSNLMELYNALENMRNTAECQLKQIKQFFGKENFPDFSQEQFTLARRGLEVWMCTLGAAISPERREDVQEMWKKLASSKHMIPEALEELRRREHLTKKILGADSSGSFELLELDKVQEMCEFVPAVFTRKVAA